MDRHEPPMPRKECTLGGIEMPCQYFNFNFQSYCGPKDSYHSMNELDLSHMSNLKVSPDSLGSGVLRFRR